LYAAFGTVPLSASDWLICSDIGSSALWLMELKKLALCLTGRSARPVVRPTSRMSSQPECNETLDAFEIDRLGV
jgi:hypothetical protein